MHAASTQLALQSAAHLAAKGEYRAASLLLESVAEGEMPASLRTLRAKILVQQGKYREALDDWREVLRQEPSNREARAALRRTEKLAESRWHWLGRYSAGFKSTMLAIVLGLGGLMAAVGLAGVPFAPFGGRAAADEPPSPSPSGPGQGDAELLERIAGLETTVREQADLLGQRLAALQGGAQPRPEASPAQEAVNREMADLEDRLSAVERTTSGEMGQSMVALEARLAAMEGSLHDQRQQMVEADRQLAERTRDMHRDLLVGRLSDLCKRLPLSEADANSARLAAHKLLVLDHDTTSVNYAKRVIEWLDEMYPTIPDASGRDQREPQRGTLFQRR